MSPRVHAPLQLATEAAHSGGDGVSEALAKPSEISHVDRLVRGIIDGFREGRYQPGERLVAADLAAQFNVSRAPVREALAILVGEGVVEIKKNYETLRLIKFIFIVLFIAIWQFFFMYLCSIYRL